METKQNWKPEWECSGKWCGNAQVFATEAEAAASAKARFQKWTVPTGHRAAPCEEPANYKWDNGDVSL